MLNLKIVTYPFIEVIDIKNKIYWVIPLINRNTRKDDSFTNAPSFPENAELLVKLIPIRT